MSFVKDALSFELFHGKDLWKRLRKDPKRLLLGVDPWSTKVWNKVLGRNDEPLVDQMGGAYGGHTFSAFGNKDGGVYERARAAGVPTGPGGKMQDLAHIIAALYAGGYAKGKMPQFGKGGSEQGGWQQYQGGFPGQGGSQEQDETWQERMERERRERKLREMLRLWNEQQQNPGMFGFGQPGEY